MDNHDKVGPEATVAVTGASGFIGARVVELLALTTTVQVRALGRNYSRLVRAAQFPEERVRLAVADLRNEAEILAAIADCDVIVHCGYGSDGLPHEQWAASVSGTETILAAAANAAARVVHVSTAAVYRSDGAVINERTALVAANPGEINYVQAKLRADEIAMKSAESADVVIIQPAVVYGPWGGDWSRRALERLLAGGWKFLPSGAAGGSCNAVYIDDVARAIVQAALPEGQWRSQRYLIGGPEQLTWGQFYDGLRDLTGTPRPPGHWDDQAVEPWERALYSSRAVVDWSLAAADLGYRPAVDLRSGMSRLGAWARWSGLVGPESAADSEAVPDGG